MQGALVNPASKTFAAVMGVGFAVGLGFEIAVGESSGTVLLVAVGLVAASAATVVAVMGGRDLAPVVPAAARPVCDAQLDRVAGNHPAAVGGCEQVGRFDISELPPPDHRFRLVQAHPEPSQMIAIRLNLGHGSGCKLRRHELDFLVGFHPRFHPRFAEKLSGGKI